MLKCITAKDCVCYARDIISGDVTVGVIIPCFSVTVALLSLPIGTPLGAILLWFTARTLAWIEYYTTYALHNDPFTKMIGHSRVVPKMRKAIRLLSKDYNFVIFMVRYE